MIMEKSRKVICDIYEYFVEGDFEIIKVVN